MSKKNILEALEGISDAISGGGGGSASGGSGNSGLGFTLVYYDPFDAQSTSLKAVENDNLVPFTVSDLIGESIEDAIKTVPILLMPPWHENPSFICNMSAISQQAGMTVLGFSRPDGVNITFRANEDSNYAFIVDDEDDDNDGDPAAY